MITGLLFAFVSLAMFPGDHPPLRAAEQNVIAHAGLDPQQAAKAMTLPEGFSAQLCAAEPDVTQPIAMAMDDRGRLWVAEGHTYPVRAKEGEGKDRILIFEDTNGDGKFDVRKVFAENLNLVSGLEVGFGGAWVGAAPYLLFIPDKNGDDVPDGPPTVLLDGWGYQDTHETLNAFIWGPDGWLYGCHGVFTHSNVGKPGAPNQDRVPINAGVWRYHPTRHVFEVFAHGTSNPWGIDFNDRGQAFITACVIPHLYHIIQHARYQRQAGPHFNPFTYDDIKTIALHRHYLGDTPHGGNGRSDAAGGGHAHAGAMLYLGGKWPSKYRDQIFMNNIHGSRINQDALAPRGSGYVGDRAPDFLLANDSWSQLLYLTYGPDGDVYVIDWYDANQCHGWTAEAHDRSNGRIFKITYGDSTAKPVDLQKLSSEELVKQLENPNDWYVRHARRILQERGKAPGIVEPLKQLALKHSDATRRLRGLWALHAIDALDDGLVTQALADSDPYVRGWVIQLACEKGTPSDALLTLFTERARSDDSPIVRLYLASAACRIGSANCVPLLKELSSHAEDAEDQNLPLMNWYAIEPLIPEQNAVVLNLLQSVKIPTVKRFIVRKMSQTSNPESLDQLLLAIADNPTSDAEKVLLFGEVIEGLKGNRTVALPASWPGVYKKFANSSHPALADAVRKLALKFGDPQEKARLRSLLTNKSAPDAARCEAIELLVSMGESDLAPTLQSVLRDNAVAATALRALATYNDPQTASAIAEIYQQLPSDAKRAALGTLSSRPPYGLALLEYVEGNRIPRVDLTADIIRQLRTLNDSRIKEKITAVWGEQRETPAQITEKINARKKLLVSQPRDDCRPDATLGRSLFKRLCQQCHKMFGEGAAIGPELTGSNRANLDYLLSNVMDPSALVGKDYQAHMIVNNAGRSFTGLIREENDQSLTLVTATETLLIPKGEIEARRISEKSMMPDGILDPLTEKELRSLVAYMASPVQTPYLADADAAKLLFNGKDLTGWSGGEGLWSVENGEIVGKTATGIKQNDFLRSDLAAKNFKLSLEVKLVNNEGNSGVQFRSHTYPSKDGLSVKGYQADIGKDWWGKLYEEHGRAILWNRSGEPFVKPGEWNRYEIEAIGGKLKTWINGNLCVDLHDDKAPEEASSGIFALQLHSGGPTEVRFRNVNLTILNDE
jgi:putative membrane-bound dehydrogenase-like protein